MDFKRWIVEIDIDEFEGSTRAAARLQHDESAPLAGIGLARLNPADRDVPEIGDELAASRALTDLGHQLLEAAAKDIESVTHHRATLYR